MRRRTGEARPRAARALAMAALAALAAAPAPGAAEGVRVRVRAEVDRDEVAAGELVTLTLRVEAPDAPESVAFPEGELPFEVVSRAESRASTFSTGGGAGVSFRQVTTYRLGLRPRGPGPMVIPSLIARVGGTVYTSTPLKVNVRAAGAAPQRPPRRATFRGWERDLLLQVELDRTEVFLGEQVTAEVWLLSPLGVAAYEGFKPPPYDGFWVEELEAPRQLEFKVRTVNGVPTRAYLVQRLALFPTRSGALTVRPFQLDVAVRSATDSPFDLLPELRRARRASAPVTVAVRPLPPGAPPGFESVNVGRLALEAKVLENEPAAGEPLTIRITATGQGNVRALSLPRLPPVPGTRRFEATTTETVAPRGHRFGGSRVVETVLVPERAGELVVPALAWPVFDPRQGRYVSHATPELRVKVGPGRGGAPTAGASALAAGLRPIRADATLVPIGAPPWRGAGFLALLAAPPVGLAALAAALRARRRTRAGAGARRTRDAAPAARRRLAAARRRIGKGERDLFLADVEGALRGYVADRIGGPAAGLTRDALAAALAERGAHPPAVRRLCAALDACDAARYGRGAVGAEELLDAAERALEALEEADRAPPRAGDRP